MPERQYKTLRHLGSKGEGNRWASERKSWQEGELARGEKMEIRRLHRKQKLLILVSTREGKGGFIGTDTAEAMHGFVVITSCYLR